MITHADYMKDNSNLHHTYFSQFVTDSVKKRVERTIGLDRIKASTGKHFNDIPLAMWYAMYPIYSGELLEQLGEWNTISTTVCVAKAAARIIKEENV